MIASFVGLMLMLAQEHVPEVEPIAPPEQGFFSKRIESMDIPIKAHASVADEALVAAAGRVRLMLENQPELAANLHDHGVQLHIIGKDQVTSDLPEHRRMKGKPFDGKLTIDERTRGVGGVLASCGEENLLKLPHDRYRGRDICVHEFAHSLFEIGMSEDLRQRVIQQARDSQARGHWKGAYATTNPSEFLAELSMWYFGTFGDTHGLDPAPRPGLEGLKEYDPEAFALLDDLYTGRLRSKRVELAGNSDRLPAQHPIEERFEPRNGPPTIVHFRNRTDHEVVLHWLPGDGTRKRYDTVAPGATRDQSTFAGHHWLVTDETDRPLAAFIAQDRPGLAEIRGTLQP